MRLESKNYSDNPRKQFTVVVISDNGETHSVFSENPHHVQQAVNAAREQLCKLVDVAESIVCPYLVKDDAPSSHAAPVASGSR